MRRRDQIAVVGITATLAVGALVAWAGSDGSTEVGGFPVFALCAIVAFAIQWVVFAPSWLNHTERFFDLTGSITYVTVTVLALALSDDLDARAWVVAACVVIWAGRLGSFLFARINREGHDARFDQMKHQFGTFLMTWTLQGLWVLFTLAAALAVITSDRRESFGVWAVVGLAVWLVGFAVEVTADRQKSAFRQNPANAGRFIDTGLWRRARHPNYFGEITLWLGVAVMALPVLSGWRWVVLVSPVFVYVLLTRISGIPLQKAKADRRWGDDPDYQAYLARTRPLLPLPRG